MDLDLPKIIKDLEDFFEIKVPDYEIVITDSREEFDKLTGQKSEPWTAGWANSHKIVAIHPDKLDELTEGIHKSDSHPKRIKHELAHLFYAKLTKGEFRPACLNEGLAFYLDGRGGHPVSDERKYVAPDYFYDYDGHVYGPSSYTVKTLIDKFGKDKMLSLIKKIRPGLTEDNFNKLFHDIYGFNFNKEDLKKILI